MRNINYMNNKSGVTCQVSVIHLDRAVSNKSNVHIEVLNQDLEFLTHRLYDFIVYPKMIC